MLIFFAKETSAATSSLLDLFGPNEVFQEIGRLFVEPHVRVSNMACLAKHWLNRSNSCFRTRDEDTSLEVQIVKLFYSHTMLSARE